MATSGVFRNTAQDRATNAVHRKVDGLLLVRRNGSVRWLRFWESVRFHLTGHVPQDCP